MPADNLFQDGTPYIHFVSSSLSLPPSLPTFPSPIHPRHANITLTMPHPLPILRGRGTAANPPNRFLPLHVEVDLDLLDEEGLPAQAPTQYFVDTSRSIIATNDSPDVGFTHSVNPYRGCSHGCVYCYARPTHEYLGFSAGR